MCLAHHTSLTSSDPQCSQESTLAIVSSGIPNIEHRTRTTYIEPSTPRNEGGRDTTVLCAPSTTMGWFPNAGEHHEPSAGAIVGAAAQWARSAKNVKKSQIDVIVMDIGYNDSNIVFSKNFGILN